MTIDTFIYIPENRKKGKSAQTAITKNNSMNIIIPILFYLILVF